MKSAMKHFGIDIGNPCRPYAPSARDHAQIGQFLQQVGLIGEAGPTPQALLDAGEKLRQEDTFFASDSLAPPPVWKPIYGMD